MILTIRQYIEALTNPEGRFRTLRKIYPVTDGSGMPVFSVPGHGLVDFEVVADGQKMVLRCPLRSDAGTEAKICALAGKDDGLASQFFTEWKLHEKEITLFDTAGNPVEIDVLSRFSFDGVTPERFLQDASAKGGVRLIMFALDSLAGLAEWLQSVNREVAAHRLIFAPDGSAHVTGFSAKSGLDDVALAFFFSAAMPERFAEIGRPLLAKAVAAKPLAMRLCVEASAFGFPEPGQILAGDIAGSLRKLSRYTSEQIFSLGKQLTELEVVESLAKQDPEEQTSGYAWSEDESDGIRCVKDIDGWRYVCRDNSPVTDRVWLFAAPFREGRAEVETVEGKGLIDKEGRCVLEPVYEEIVWDEYWGLIVVMLEGRWSLLDREGTLLTENHYDWLGECSEGLVLAQKDGKCGFLDTEGHEAIPFIYDDATSFSEGCAFVTCGKEKFFINGQNEKI